MNHFNCGVLGQDFDYHRQRLVPDLRQVGLQGFVDAEGQPLHRRTKLRIHLRLVAADINAVPLYPLLSWVVIGIPLLI